MGIMRTLCILLALAWAGSAAAASSPREYIAEGRKAEAAAMAKTPGLAKRDGDTLTFFSNGKPVARLTYRWQPNTNGDPIDYNFREAVRLKEPGEPQATLLAAAEPSGFEISEAFIVDGHGQGWLFPYSYEKASPDGQYITSIKDFGFRYGDALIVDWSNPQKPTQIVVVCAESRWVSATEIVGICTPLVERYDVGFVRMSLKAQSDGRWLMTELAPVRQVTSKDTIAFQPIKVAKFVPVSKLSTPGATLERMGPPLETLSKP